jgi:hypothetical protein
MSVKANVSAGKAFGHAVEAFRNTHPNNPLRKLDDHIAYTSGLCLLDTGYFRGGRRRGEQLIIHWTESQELWLMLRN